MINTYQKEPETQEYKKIKVGVKQLEDASLDLGTLKKAMPRHGFTNKSYILNKIAQNDLIELRAISNFYYNLNGIYERACNHFAFLYRYDWYVAPDINDSEIKQEKILKDFSKILTYLDNSNLKQLLGDIALKVVKNGCYYGYIIDSPTELCLQELPPEYCRVRYSVGTFPAVEFNMRFFDDKFSDPVYRLKVINMFPDDFKKGYMLYRQHKLTSDNIGVFNDNLNGWYLLEPGKVVKFNINGNDTPVFINAIPSILDLDLAQDLDRRKQMQKLLKIIVQKLPMDKNGDLIFDVDEAKDIHNNAVAMLKRSIGVDVLTTFTDVQSIDLSDRNTSTTTDDLEKIERALFNALGISQNIFNTDGNLSLEKSILNDEACMRSLLLQFSAFINKDIKRKFATNKKYTYNFYMLETTQYNYQNLAKLYKEQTQIGYSKMLPQIALGHSQNFILNSMHFENEVLHLPEIMIPPLMSSTMSSEDILSKKTTDTNKSSGNQAGRPQKAEDEKSEKTIQNQESMN